MNRNKFHLLITVFTFFLISWLNHLSFLNKALQNNKSNLYSHYNQLPLSTNALADYSVVIEKEDNEDKDKFLINLFYNYITEKFNISSNFYKSNYFSNFTFLTNLYSGIPIYSAIRNYRI